MPHIIDGKAIRDYNLELMKKETAALNAQNIYPCLSVIIVGNDPASRVYVNNKKAACEKIGIISREYALPEETTTQELLNLIDELNADEKVSGILCQMPVPKHIDSTAVLNRILPEKDVDCFHPLNVGKLSAGNGTVMPCTPMGIIKLLEYEKIDPTGKTCVVIGRSNIVGKPMAVMMSQADATVTLCHSKTVDLPSVTRNADILISSVGKPKFVTADMVKEGAIVIDVGMNRDENNKLCGDVDFENVAPKTSYITPVPGGVGPMTITMLMRNTIEVAKEQAKL
ncbi:MAG: bifunctional methylenetetrahydrofolate dehydrogenase/methenyltetrahydrofolate cyclohydrolase FolD [Clostridia bacterium]|nr:bifunctional methylenetetrahydrofolate dehydrogenase/methenyltetrahydrofolate cyclohydrolase FolD [Clostridia bacterium]